METARDLACPALWQQSLERSLARRGRPTRSSLELFHLQPERDLSHPEVLRESLTYSQLRRSAAARRPSIAVPGAGGISALALLAATTLPGLVGGRGGGHAGSERVAFRGGAERTRLQQAPTAGLAVDPALAGRAAATPALPPSMPARPAGAPARPATPQPATSHSAHLSSTSPSSAHSLRPSHPATALRHVALARDAAARHASAGAAHAVSGGAAPAAHKPSVAAARVPAEPQPSGHPSTGGGAVENASHRAVARALTSTHRTAARHPVPATTHRAPATTHRASARTHTTPATTHRAPARTHTAPATTHPAPKAAAPAPPPPVAGRYANPLAGTSLTPERIDQGVDYSGSGTLSAIGNGKVTYVGTSGTGWPGAFVEYQLSDGAYAGRYVYYAESITPAGGLHVGQAVRAGQPIASVHGGIEIGWGSGLGTQTLAQADGQWSSGDDSDNHASPAGKDFSALIARLGAQPGKVEG